MPGLALGTVVHRVMILMIGEPSGEGAIRSRRDWAAPWRSVGHMCAASQRGRGIAGTMTAWQLLPLATALISTPRHLRPGGRIWTGRSTTSTTAGRTTARCSSSCTVSGVAAQLGGDSAHPLGDVSGPGDRPRRLRAHPATRAVTAHRRQPRPARPLRRRGHRSTGHPRGQLDGRPPQHAPRRRAPRPRGGAGPRRPCRSGGPDGTPDPLVTLMFGAYAVPAVGRVLHVSSPQPVLRRGAGPGGAAALLRRHRAGAGHVVRQHLQLAREREDYPDVDAELIVAGRSLVFVLARRRWLYALMGRISVPVLLIHGSKDRLVPIAAARWVATATRRGGSRSPRTSGTFPSSRCRSGPSTDDPGLAGLGGRGRRARRASVTPRGDDASVTRRAVTNGQSRHGRRGPGTLVGVEAVDLGGIPLGDD